MVKWRDMLLAALIASLSIVVLGNSGSTDAIESPHYKIVLLESDFQVRLYSESTWMSAPADDLSYEKATLCGYAR